MEDQSAHLKPLATPESSFRRSILSYGFANFFSRALSFLLVFAYAWILDPASVGVLALIESAAIFLSTAYLGGLDLAAHERLNRVSSIADPEGAVDTLLAMQFRHTLGGSLISAALILALPIETKIGLSKTDLILATVLAAFSSLNQLGLSIQQARHRARSYLRAITWSSIVTVAVGLFLVIVVRAGVLGVIMGRIAGLSISILLARPSFSLRIKLAIAGLAAWPLMFYQLLVQALNIGDRFILAIFLPQSDVGRYSLAYAVGMTLHYVTLSIWQAWSPHFHFLAQQGEATRRQRAETTARSLENIIVLAILVCALSWVVVRIVLAPVYWSAAELIPWIAVGYTFHAAFLFFQLPIIQTNRLMLSVYVTGLAAVVNVTTNILLIPRFGIMAAALATAVGFSIQAVAALFFAQRCEHLPYPLRRLLWLTAILIAAAVAGSLQSHPSIRMTAMVFSAMLLVLALVFIRKEIHQWLTPMSAQGQVE